MAKLWDDVRKSLKDFSSAAMEKAEEFGKVASDKAEELTKVGKINWEIKQLKRTREKHLQDLGTLVLDAANEEKLTELTKNETISEIITEIKTVDAEIKIKQDRIDAIHEEFGLPAEEIIKEAEKDAAPTEDAEIVEDDKPADEGDTKDEDKKA